MLFLNYHVPKSRGLQHLIFPDYFSDPRFGTAIANYVKLRSLFSFKIFWETATVALSFACDKYCVIID